MQKQKDEIKIKSLAKDIIGGIVEGIGGFLFLSGSAILAYQVYFWVLESEWNSFSLGFVLSFFPAIPWLEKPQVCYALHDLVMLILNLVPLSLVLVTIGIVLLSWGEYIKEE